MLQLNARKIISLSSSSTPLSLVRVTVIDFIFVVVPPEEVKGSYVIVD